jgi:hypothetical protein
MLKKIRHIGIMGKEFERTVERLKDLDFLAQR